MKVRFRTGFVRDLKKIKDRSVLSQVKSVVQRVEAAGNLQEIPGLKQLSGERGFFRIRLGDHRIGIAIEESEVEFVRFLHRRDIYRYFP